MTLGLEILQMSFNRIVDSILVKADDVDGEGRAEQQLVVGVDS
jgi:hypothetical protein